MTDEASPVMLRPAQQRVMHDTINFLVDHDKGYVSMPTGTGKTILFSQLLAATELRALVVVPTRQLVGQTLEELSRWDIQARSLAEVRTVQNAERVFPSQVHVGTYASFVRHTRAGGSFSINPEDYDLLILDEAHHAMAEGASETLKRYNHAYQIGFTATPNYSEARQLQEHLPKVIHDLTIPEAIEMRLVTPFVNVIVATGTDISEVRSVGGDYDAKELDAAIDINDRNDAIAELYADNLPGKKTIFSCNTIEHASHMTAALRRHGVSAAYIHGRMSAKDQSTVLEAFKAGTITALCNNKILTEGFDDPTVEAVINVSPTLSHVRQQQRTGRGLRLDRHTPGKELIVIDVLDIDQRRKPVLFFDENIAGSTGIATARPHNQTLIEKLKTYSKHSLTILADDETIFGYTDTLVKPSTSKKRKPRDKQKQKTKQIKRSTSSVKARGKQPTLTPVDVPERLFFAEREPYVPTDTEPIKDWRENANCKDQHSDALYPSKGGSTNFGKFLCSRCVVQDECLTLALENDERFGIWGGLSERERRKLKRLSTLNDDNASEIALEYLSETRRTSYSRAQKAYGKQGLIITTVDSSTIQDIDNDFAEEFLEDELLEIEH